MSAKKIGITAKILMEIRDTTNVVLDESGSIAHYLFNVKGVEYKMERDGVLYVFNSKTCSFIPKRVSYCKSGIYPSYTINGVSVMAYLLSMVVSDKDFLDTYLSDKNLVVNHTVVSDEYSLFSHTQYNKKTNKEVAFNPEYLELITQSENRLHGLFLSTYRLYNVYVSSKDIDILRLLVTNPYSVEDNELREKIIEDNKRIVVNHYKNEGYTKKLLFE